MTGIVIAGMGIGGLIAPPVLSRLIEAYGWRLSYVIMGGTVLLIMIAAAQLLRLEPARHEPLPDRGHEGKQQELKLQTESFSFKEAVHTTQFWVFFFMHTCFGLCLSAIVVHIVPHAIDLGISAISAANILAYNSGMGIIGTLVLGSLGDRIGNRQVFMIGFGLILVSLCCLMLADEVWMFYLFAVVFGFAQGGTAPQGSPMLARLFGLGSHGLILGVVGVGFRVGAGIGPFVAGYLFDLTGSYRVPFLVCIALTFASLMFTIMLKPTRRLGGRI